MPGTLLITLTLTSLVAVPLHFVWMRFVRRKTGGFKQIQLGRFKRNCPSDICSEHIYCLDLHLWKGKTYTRICWDLERSPLFAKSSLVDIHSFNFWDNMIQGGLLPVMSRAYSLHLSGPRKTPFIRAPYIALNLAEAHLVNSRFEKFGWLVKVLGFLLWLRKSDPELLRVVIFSPQHAPNSFRDPFSLQSHTTTRINLLHQETFVFVDSRLSRLSRKRFGPFLAFLSCVYAFQMVQT